ncbi:MAG TPA: dihydroxy-acid dehydratase, partial [Bryobacteraceae bacterium]|nr:dihydroxy-acid dehydratase [Bryobacteraceae bacterium]
HAAGGIPAVMKRLETVLDLDALAGDGRKWHEVLSSVDVREADVIPPLTAPVVDRSLVVLRGNLVPRGAILKVSAASPHLLRHTGRALVFDSYEDMLRRIDDPSLDVSADSVLILRNCGPQGAPGMPEWGSIPVPARLAKQGVRDIVRISDARISGTSYGTIVVHACPEAAAGGPLSLVRNGDEILLDVAERKLELLVSEAEIKSRFGKLQPHQSAHLRGYPRLFIDHVLQADQGCDFDVLRPRTADEVPFVPPVVGRS